MDAERTAHFRLFAPDATSCFSDMFDFLSL